MKPVYLEFCGINSFSEKTQIDFSKLLEGGLFGIFGDTGSGKSTILDCIHFALYGKIERSSGTDSINYKCDKAYVIYDFEIVHDGARHTYRAQRERRRKNNVAKAFLYRLGEKGTWEGLAEGVNEVDARIEEIIGLSFEDFKKCIALPQGEFAGLVKARPAERLQLVSRLFDLEKYGDRLSKAVRDRCQAAENDLAVLRSRLQENAEGTEERLAEEKKKLEAAQAGLTGVKVALEEAEKEFTAVSRLAEEKKEYDALKLKAARAGEKLAFYTERREKLERYAAAVAVRDKSAELAELKKKKALAEAQAEKAETFLAAAKETVRVKKNALQTSGLEERAESLAVAQGKLESAEEDVKACRAAEEKLGECTARYKELKNKVPKEDFDGLLAAVDAEKAALGEDESFTEYLRRSFRDVLISETCGEIREDLRELGRKYPETEEDVAALIRKYAPAEKGSDRFFDIAAAQQEFKKAEKKRAELSEKRREIEARKQAFEANEREKERVVEDGKHYRERWEAAKQKIQSVKDLGTPEEVKKQLEAVKRAKKKAEDDIAAAEQKQTEWTGARESGRAQAELYAGQAEEAEKALTALLKENGFSGETEARSLVAEIGDSKRAKEECDAFFEEYNLTANRLSQIPAEKFDGFSETRFSEAEERKRSLASENERLIQEIAVGKREVDRIAGLRARCREIGRECAAKEKERELLEKLRLLTQRGKFMEFIASEYLQEVCVSASRTLLSLTGGRYFLRYEDEFRAGDNLNGGTLRSVRTLSGGETFLVSLSLALALSGAICAKSLRPIEFFFLDEGFGTLDEKLVDTVMDVLEKLRSRNFSVGIISHVEELKHRIDHKILVSGATEQRGSSVRVEAY